MNRIARTTITTTVTVLAASGLLGYGAQAGAQNGRPSGSDQAYTTLDHPSLPCRLSVEAVANWGETSAHLPQACTYGEKE